ncbi:MAG: protein-methionine-sulfoxide reductase heme-binding subunit MsrQ [Hoeflea sp.]|uniref:protein-methionine-sulfoxide reductase heme-binding subunit MsrQ n=1 Tax=Hoeflea sp. TaxID=1940281 RepID=UPI001E16205D|nr:protein-methionine-sulfoxide reductase heme-binding subunit MsrQ [Hoeflea sp.]MBU4528001.1 protein-methionine-sulfoxide reductase heme-binding subunit MsrQ [Alphaproteobacteria bacterium]MBU4542881.1 protein-methionine-sulfoxide reductase heme-binding subunit MsrQ [Alphaproteobacteria bacterium]MBU4551396.1 protein-methionine-sulfoxide reductase heme-binding subunit MsrQ [Alphaproteobacteria bacterium]MBV1722779.1 protein-methionine-sulfoxide reductase heme-binding subunit MsrQ [Hoeflea sp.]
MVLPALPRRYHAASIWALYALGLVPAVWTFYLGATGQLIGNPVKIFEHLLGIWALRFLILTLAIAPLRDLAGINWVRYRRALGLLAFWYVAMHFLTYMVLDKRLAFDVIVEDITKRWFITIGMAALVMLIPLALTSNSWSIRRLGTGWGKLHRLIYAVAAAGALHFCLAVKVVGPEQLIYAGLVAVLIGWRLVRHRFMQRRRARRLAEVGS